MGAVTVLAAPYTEAPHVLRTYADQLSGRVSVDPTNPVDLGTVELLDRAWLVPFNSGAALIEAEAPADASFVKAFNTNFAGPLYGGAVDGSPLDAFVAGDDPDGEGCSHGVGVRRRPARDRHRAAAPLGSRGCDLLGLLVLRPVRPGVNLDAPRALCLRLGDPEGENPVGQ